MLANSTELNLEIEKTSAFMQPARIVVLYKAITGCRSLPANLSMRDMFEIVVQAASSQAGDSTQDILARLVSE